MAHTFLSFELDTPQGKHYFSISVEIRREENELFSPLAGLFRHYELMYVVWIRAGFDWNPHERPSRRSNLFVPRQTPTSSK